MYDSTIIMFLLQYFVSIRLIFLAVVFFSGLKTLGFLRSSEVRTSVREDLERQGLEVSWHLKSWKQRGTAVNWSTFKQKRPVGV